MAALVVWMDGREAKVLKLSDQGVQTIPLKAHGPKHPAEPHGKHGQHEQELKFFRELSEVLKEQAADATEWLVTGPGLAAEHFRTFLENHHADMAKRIVAVTKSDHPSPAELLKAAQQVFRRLDLFGVVR